MHQLVEEKLDVSTVAFNVLFGLSFVTEFEEEAGVTNEVELRVLRLVFRWDSCHQLLVDMSSSLLRVLHHHKLEGIQGLQFEMLNDRSLALLPEFAMFFPETLDHMLEVECHVMCEIHSCLGISQVPREVSIEGLAT